MAFHCVKTNVLRHSSSQSLPSERCFDIVVVGGGIVGIAAAREILRRKPHLKCAIVEKESQLASHQSSHNSGVVHAGIYYTPGSMRALLCRKYDSPAVGGVLVDSRMQGGHHQVYSTPFFVFSFTYYLEGMDMAYKYCDKHGIPYKEVGKLIVATDKEELPRLANLYERGLANEVKNLVVVDAKDIADIEPHCVGIRALHSPHTGIVDWGSFAQHLGSDFQDMGGRIFLNFELKILDHHLPSAKDPDISKYPVKLASRTGDAVFAGNVLCCAGLYADRIAELSGGKKDPAILPVRGEFLELTEEKRHLVKGNIYPIPDPKFPFLGVHFTPRMDGRVLIGPNAVLAFKREGYSYSDISVSDCMDFLMYPGFRSLALSNLQFGLGEFARSVFMRLQLKKIQKFLPNITMNDIKKGPTGVRAQALSPHGELVEDFVFEGGSDQNSRILHCRNTPSPAATSSLAIAQVLADKMFETLGAEHKHI